MINYEQNMEVPCREMIGHYISGLRNHMKQCLPTSSQLTLGILLFKTISPKTRLGYYLTN